VVRKEAVAGYFYPGRAEELRRLFEELSASASRVFPEDLSGLQDASGVVSPHAGYIYSGVAACVAHRFLALLPPAQTIVLLGPNHRGVGRRVAISNAEYWQTPLGQVPVDRESAEFLLSCSSMFALDELAHRFEHSLEVQVPFLQYFLSYEFKILPIALLSQDRVTSEALGEALFALSEKKRILVVASSDFSHYEPEAVARTKDGEVIERICALDVEGFYRVLREKDVSVCGPGGIAALLVYHKKRGGERGELLYYTHSGEVTGERHQVVGYAAVAFPLP